MPKSLCAQSNIPYMRLFNSIGMAPMAALLAFIAHDDKVTCRSDTVLLVSPGFQADARTLHKVIQQRYIQYQFAHRRPMSVSAMAQLLGNTLYYKRFFPYYTFNLCCGLDAEGRRLSLTNAGFDVVNLHLSTRTMTLLQISDKLVLLAFAASIQQQKVFLP